MNKVKIGFPVEYEDENNIARNGLFLRELEIKELEKRLKEINKVINLEQQCQKQQEVIDKITSNIKNDIDGFMTINDHGECNSILDLLNIYLDVLNGVSE